MAAGEERERKAMQGRHTGLGTTREREGEIDRREGSERKKEKGLHVCRGTTTEARNDERSRSRRVRVQGRARERETTFKLNEKETRVL